MAVVGKQDRGSTSAYGTTVDFNVFDAAWVRAWPAAPAPPVAKEDDMPFLIHNAAGTYWEMCPGGFKKAIVFPALQAYAEAAAQGFSRVTDVKLADTIINQIPDLPAPVATVDVAAIAKAVNDELARRQKE